MIHQVNNMDNIQYVRQALVTKYSTLIV